MKIDSQLNLSIHGIAFCVYQVLWNKPRNWTSPARASVPTFYIILLHIINLVKGVYPIIIL